MIRKVVSGVCTVFVAVIVLLSVSCVKKAGYDAVIDFFTGKVTVVRGNTEEPAEVKKQLFPSDSVVTGKESHAYIQFGETHMIHLSGSTECALSKVPEMISAAVSGTEVYLKRGSAGVIAGKLMKNGSFQVSTPTILVAVRGTLFRVVQEGDYNRVAVSEGKVIIKSVKGLFSEVLLASGKEAVIRGSSVVIRDCLSDKGYFRKLKTIEPVKNILTVDESELAKIFSSATGKGEQEIKAADKGSKWIAVPPVDTGSAEKKEEKPEAETVKARVAVTLLAANGIEPSEAAGISEKLYSNLVRLKGGSSVVYRKKFDKRSANRVLTGRVSKLGRSRIISVSIVDGESGTVIFNRTLTIKGDQNIDDSIRNIAEQIAGNVQVWE